LEEVVEAGRAEEKPRRKKKKKKRPKDQPSHGIPGWAWWAGGLAGCLVLAVVGMVWAVRAGHVEWVITYCISLAVMLPVSLGILVLSMVVCSHLAGGIDFGEVHTAIPKAAALLLVINLINVLPFGAFLAFPVWLVGLMRLFGLDLWESRFLVAINWILNALAKTFLLGVVLAVLTHPKSHRDLADQPRQPHGASAQEDDLDAIEEMGGEYDVDEGSPGTPVVRVSFSGKPVGDAALVRLKNLPQLRTLELGSTRITDAGLTNLKGLTSLQTLDLSRTGVSDAGLAALKGLNQLQRLVLTGTQVTNAGVQDLQRALPRVNIVR
jgi:hypothetical protein